MACGLDMTVAVTGSLKVSTAFAIRALWSTVFPLRLCYLIITINVHKVLSVVVVVDWSLDHPCGCDNRRWRGCLVRSVAWAASVLTGEAILGLEVGVWELKTVLFKLELSLWASTLPLMVVDDCDGATPNSRWVIEALSALGSKGNG